MRVPDFSPASITSTASAIPTMMRFRDGKYCGRAPVSGGCSERRAPPEARICCAMPKLVRGAI